MNVFIKIFKEIKITFFIAVLFGLISGAGQVFIIGYVTQGQAERPHALLFFLLLVFCIIVLDTFSRVLISKFSQQSIYSMQINLCKKILSLPYVIIESFGQSKLYAVLSQDIMLVTNFFAMTPGLLISVAVIVAGLIYLGTISMRLLWVVVMMFVLILLCSLMLDLCVIRRKYESARQSVDLLFSALRDLLDGGKELRLSRKNRDRFLDQDLNQAAFSWYQHNFSAMTVFAVNQGVWQVVFYAFLALIAFMPTHLALVNPADMLRGVIVVIYVMSPLGSIMGSLPMFRRALVSCQKISELNEAIGSPGFSEKPIGLPITKRGGDRLVISHITYQYRQHEMDFQLGPINMELHSSEIVFIVGANGSGKSTLVKILAGLYRPDEGSMSFNGTPITNENIAEYRENVSVLFYTFYLFKNLMSEGKVNSEEWARKLNISSFVDYNGMMLLDHMASDGQKRRLAMLSLIVQDRPIVIFDEPTADQDIHFKKCFYETILGELKSQGKCVIVISHDSQFFSIADRTISLDKGIINF